MPEASLAQAEEEELVALSALQHWLYCPRQCALIHLERQWSDNRFTAEGNAMHERAHDGPNELREGSRIGRGQPVRSSRLGLVGQCDVVEFGADGSVTPIEYKRGKPKAHRADEVQLCAQAICLEEMLRLGEGGIGEGFLYYGKRRRRTAVAFDAELRRLVAETAAGVRRCLQGKETPKAEYQARRCDACSLIETCQPRLLDKSARKWFDQELEKRIGASG